MTRRLPGRSSHLINSSANLPTIAKVVRHRDLSEFALLVRKKLRQPSQITVVLFNPINIHTYLVRRYRLNSFLTTIDLHFFKNFPDYSNVQNNCPKKYP